jgi:uncharacterized OB-fold protein
MSVHELTASRCSSCGHTTVYRHSRCPKCKAMSFVEVRFKEGRVLTYTVLGATRPGFQKPLTLVMVEFEKGMRAVGQLDRGQPSTGLRVRVSHGQLSETEGVISTGLKFVPAQ